MASDFAPPAALDAAPRHLHPLSPVLDLARFSPQAILPILFLLARQPAIAVPIAILGAVALVALRYVGWTRFTYELDGQSLVVEKGLLNRERNVVPTDRVQQVDLQRKIRHRVFGLVAVRIDTAGGGGRSAEVTLDAVSEAEAARLRAVLAGGHHPAVAAPVLATAGGAHGAPASPVPAAVIPGAAWTDVPAERELITLGMGRLALGGISGSKLLVVFAGLGFLFGLVDDLPRSMSDQILDTAEGTRPTAVIIALALVLAIPVWLGIAAIGAILTDGGFRLVRRGDVLHLSRGLLDQREASLAVSRVQAVRVHQNRLRALLGLVSVTVQSAGGAGKVDGADSRVVVPILSEAELDGFLAEVLPGASPLPALNAAPPAARRRAWIRRLVPTAMVVLVVALLLRPVGLTALLILPLAAGFGELAYRGLGWAASGNHVVARRGGLLRETVIVPVAKLQSTRLVSSPFQRRVGLSTLLLDVAGRGGVPAIVDGATSDLAPLRRWSVGTLARRDEAAVRQQVVRVVEGMERAAWRDDGDR